MGTESALTKQWRASYEMARDECQRLRAELDALRDDIYSVATHEDAQRYRWLREKWIRVATSIDYEPPDTYRVKEVFLKDREEGQFDRESLDAAIDAARGE